MKTNQTALIRDLQIDKMLNNLTIEQRFQLLYDLTFIDEDTDIEQLRDFLSDSKKELKALQKAVDMNEKNILSMDTANWDRLVIEDAIRIFKKTSER